jgi:hypothetical protein
MDARVEGVSQEDLSKKCAALTEKRGDPVRGAHRVVEKSGGPTATAALKVGTAYTLHQSTLVTDQYFKFKSEVTGNLALYVSGLDTSTAVWVLWHDSVAWSSGYFMEADGRLHFSVVKDRIYTFRIQPYRGHAIFGLKTRVE